MSLEITDQNIDDILGKNEFTIIDFWAEWCGPCKMMGPIIDQIALANEAIAVGKLDITNNNISSQKYEISSIPCFILFKNGEEIGRIKGAMPKGTLQTWINSHKD